MRRATTVILAIAVALAAPACERAPSARSRATIHQLSLALRNGDASTRLAAASELRTFGRAAIDALPALANALSDDSSALVRMSAAAALGAAGPDAIPTLVRGMTDDDEQVRAAVIGALGVIRITDDTLIRTLAGAMNDKSEIVRSRAVWAAERVGPDAAHIVRVAMRDRSSLVRSRAEMAARKLDEQSSGRAETPASAVLELARDLSNPIASKRRQAAQDLAALERDATPALGALSAALNDADRHVRVTVVAALTHIGHPAMPSLIVATRDADSGVRARAATGIGRFGTSGADAIPHLIALLRDDEVAVRLAAVGALERIGPAAQAALHIASDDAARIVRDRAERAVQNIQRNTAARAASR